MHLGCHHAQEEHGTVYSRPYPSCWVDYDLSVAEVYLNLAEADVAEQKEKVTAPANFNTFAWKGSYTKGLQMPQKRAKTWNFVITAQSGENASRHVLTTNSNEEMVAEGARWPLETFFFFFFYRSLRKLLDGRMKGIGKAERKRK